MEIAASSSCTGVGFSEISIRRETYDNDSESGVLYLLRWFTKLGHALNKF